MIRLVSREKHSANNNDDRVNHDRFQFRGTQQCHVVYYIMGTIDHSYYIILQH